MSESTNSLVTPKSRISFVMTRFFSAWRRAVTSCVNLSQSSLDREPGFEGRVTSGGRRGERKAWKRDSGWVRGISGSSSLWAMRMSAILMAWGWRWG